MVQPYRMIAREAQMKRLTRPQDREVIDFDAPLTSYIEMLGLSIEELTAEKLCMCLAARNLENTLNKLRNTPLAIDNTSPSDENTLLAQEGAQPLDVEVEEKPWVVPTDALDITQTRHLRDLPDLLPHQWAYEEVAPELFLHDLLAGKLMRAEYLETVASAEEERQTREVGDFLEESCKSVSQHDESFILLDASTSMDSYDHRGVVARGLSLAFLRRSFARGFPLHFAPFREDILHCTSGSDTKTFQEIVSEIFDLQNASSTNIQRALDSVSTILQSKKELRHCELLLVTDGLSRLSQRPPSEIRLHSVLVGDIALRTHWKQREELDLVQQVKTLQEWSNSFVRLDVEELRDALTVTAKDLEAFEKLVTDIEKQEYLGSEELENAALFCSELGKFLDARGVSAEDEGSLERVKRKAQAAASRFQTLSQVEQPSMPDIFSQGESLADFDISIPAPIENEREISERAPSKSFAGEATEREADNLVFANGSFGGLGNPLRVLRILYRRFVNEVRKFFLRFQGKQ